MVKHLIVKDSTTPRADFRHRVKIGLIGFSIITLISVMANGPARPDGDFAITAPCPGCAHSAESVSHVQ